MEAGELTSINTGYNGVIRIPIAALTPEQRNQIIKPVDRLRFDDPWLTKEEVAEFLGMSVQSLKRLMESQELWVKPDGRTFRIYVKSILDLLGADELYTWQIQIPAIAPTPAIVNPSVQEAFAQEVATRAYGAAYRAVMDWFRANAGTADQLALWPEPSAQADSE